MLRFSRRLDARQGERDAGEYSGSTSKTPRRKCQPQGIRFFGCPRLIAAVAIGLVLGLPPPGSKVRASGGVVAR